MKKLFVSLLAALVFFAFVPWENFKIVDHKKIEFHGAVNRAAAAGVFDVIQGGAAATKAEITAVENTLVREGFTIGSNALKADYETFAEQTWQRLTLVQRAAVDDAIAAETVGETAGLAAGIAEFALPVAIATGIFAVGYYVYQNQGQIMDFLGLTPTTSVTYTAQTVSGDPVGLTFSHDMTISPSEYFYVHTPYAIDTAFGNSYVVYASIGVTWTVVSSSIRLMDTGGHTDLVDTATLKASDGKITQVGVYMLWSGAIMSAFNSNIETTTQKSVPGGTSDQDTSYYNNDYQQTSGKDLTVTGPDPNQVGGMTADQYKQLQGNPVSTVGTAAAEPTPTGTQDTSWWKWLMAPLAAIQQVAQSILNFMQDCWKKVTEWATSIISTLADLLGAANSILSNLTSWFQTLWSWLQRLLDSIGSLGASLGGLLQSILGNLGSLATTLWSWLQSLLDAIQGLATDVLQALEGLATDVLSIPDTIIDGLKDLFIPTDANAVKDMFVPISDTVKDKFNSPDDFRQFAPVLGENGCPPDIYANVLGRGSVKVVDLQIVCDNKDWWKPIMTGFMWFLFGWWLFRKANAIMARNGGVK